MMDFQVKVFNWQDQAKHVVLIARGVMEKARFKKLFEDIEMVTQGFNQCKVLVDLSESTYAVNSVEIDSLVAELPLDRWQPSNRIAFVSATGIADYHRLQFLRTGIVNRGLSAAVFHDPKIAVDWLAERQYSPGLSR
jgi:hypothetical protein